MNFTKTGMHYIWLRGVGAIRHAWRNYRSTYVELYGADVLNTNNALPLKKWDRFFHAVKDAREGRGTPTLESPNSPSQRLRWNRDELLSYQVRKSPNLSTWTPIDTNESMDGDIALPATTGQKSDFYQLEILQPARQLRTAISTGNPRDSFESFRRTFNQGPVSCLKSITRRQPCFPNKTSR